MIYAPKPPILWALSLVFLSVGKRRPRYLIANWKNPTYATQALLTSKDIESRIHKGVLQQFSHNFVQSGDLPVSLARNLKRTYGLRQLSDYEASIALTEELAMQALKASVEFVEQVRGYLNSVD